MFYLVTMILALVAVNGELHRVQFIQCPRGEPINVELDKKTLAEMEEIGFDDSWGTITCGDHERTGTSLPLGKRVFEICDARALKELGPNFKSTDNTLKIALSYQFPVTLEPLADLVVPHLVHSKKIIIPECFMVLYYSVSEKSSVWLKCDDHMCFVEGSSTVRKKDGSTVVGKDFAFERRSCLKICNDDSGPDGFGNYGINPTRDCVILDRPHDCNDDPFIERWPLVGKYIRGGNISITTNGNVAYLKGQAGPSRMSDLSFIYSQDAVDFFQVSVNALKASMSGSVGELREDVSYLEAALAKSDNRAASNTLVMKLSIIALCLSGVLYVILIFACLAACLRFRHGVDDYVEE